MQFNQWFIELDLFPPDCEKSLKSTSANGQFREIVGVLRRKIFVTFARWLLCRRDCETHYFAKLPGCYTQAGATVHFETAN